MLYAYIGVALLLVLLIGFVALSVLWMSRRVSADIKGRTLELISSYDALLEKRSRELAQLEENIRRRAAGAAAPVTVKKENIPQSAPDGMAVLNMVERIGNAVYVDDRAGGVYRCIRGAFGADPAEVFEKLPDKGSYEPGPAGRLLEQLSYETVYQLSTLSSQEQEQLLRESLEGEYLPLLDGFLSGAKRFSSIEFYDYLKAAAAMEPQKPKLYVSPSYKGGCPEGAELIVDPQICEGFQIEAGNVLYDYCIKERELSR